MQFPLSDRSTIVVTGKERTSWLNGLVTSDVSKLAAGKAQYGLLVEKKGRIQADFFAVASEDALALAVPRELRDAVLATLDHHLIMEDAELTTPELHWYYSSSLVTGAFAGTIGLLAEGDAIVATAEPLADAADATVFEAMRIERGLPRFGAEFDATFYPQEANLEKIAVSFDKGCYLGQEVVYMLENRGHVKKKLVPVDLEGDAPAPIGAAVTTAEGGEAIGDVKSSVVGPTKKTPVAIAMVKWNQSKPGTSLMIDGRKAVVRQFP
jgi:folate-binding protein YgfZ